METKVLFVIAVAVGRLVGIWTAVAHSKV